MRIDGRRLDQARQTRIQPGILATAEGSALIESGHTKIICAATVEDRVPRFLRGTARGWVHCRIRHASAFDIHPEATRGIEGPPVRADVRNPTADRPLPAGGGRLETPWREDHHRGLRRASGRRRHAHRLSHGRLGCNGHRHSAVAGVRSDRAQPDPALRGGDQRGNCRWHAHARSLLRGGFASRGRHECRDDLCR